MGGHLEPCSESAGGPGTWEVEDRAVAAPLVWASQEERTRASSGSLWPQLGDRAQRQWVSVEVSAGV